MQMIPLQIPEAHWSFVKQERRSPCLQTPSSLNCCPAGHSHAPVVLDQVAPEPAAHEHALWPTSPPVVEPLGHGLQGSTPPGPQKPERQRHVPLALGPAPGPHCVAHLFCEHRPPAQSVPRTHELPSGWRHAPRAALTTKGLGQRHTLDESQTLPVVLLLFFGGNECGKSARGAEWNGASRAPQSGPPSRACPAPAPQHPPRPPRKKQNKKQKTHPRGSNTRTRSPHSRPKSSRERKACSRRRRRRTTRARTNTRSCRSRTFRRGSRAGRKARPPWGSSPKRSRRWSGREPAATGRPAGWCSSRRRWSRGGREDKRRRCPAPTRCEAARTSTRSRQRSRWSNRRRKGCRARNRRPRTTRSRTCSRSGFAAPRAADKTRHTCCGRTRCWRSCC